MIEQLIIILQFIVDGFLHIWPYLLITIPLAVAVNMSGATRYINRAFVAGPMVTIVLATAVGAFSPFCSCGVIPVIAALLIGGVPLAPVMAFWIASPSMDPEIFFLSVGTLGWELAVWRLVSTLLLSLSAGFITHFIFKRGWLGDHFLRDRHTSKVRSTRQLLREGWRGLRARTAIAYFGQAHPQPELENSGSTLSLVIPVTTTATAVAPNIETTACATATCAIGTDNSCDSGCASRSCDSGSTCALQPPTFRQRLLQETWTATRMVMQFMALAFLLEALILLFVPQEWIISLLGAQNQLAVPLAALLGIPIYTSNLTALPMIGGLLAQGMSPAAALTFLVAGPTTTLPAMAAVWGLVQQRVFALYVLISLVGALTIGLIYSMTMSF